MVFISYSRKDKAFVEPLVKLLRASGQKVFFDKDNIEFGKNWIDELKKAINESTRFLLFWSKSTRESRVVKEEIELALSHPTIIIVPIILDKCPLPAGISKFNGSDDLTPTFQYIVTQRKRNKRIALLMIVLGIIFSISFLFNSYASSPSYLDPDLPRAPLSTDYLALAAILSVPIIIVLSIIYLIRVFKIRSNYRLLVKHLDS